MQAMLELATIQPLAFLILTTELLSATSIFFVVVVVVLWNPVLWPLLIGGMQQKSPASHVISVATVSFLYGRGCQARASWKRTLKQNQKRQFILPEVFCFYPGYYWSNLCWNKSLPSLCNPASPAALSCRESLIFYCWYPSVAIGENANVTNLRSLLHFKTM